MSSHAAVMAKAQNHFEVFGTLAAKRLIDRVSTLPPDQGVAVMRDAMNRMSPTAFARAESYAQDVRRTGTDPATALHFGTAKALTESLLTELQSLGENHIAANGSGLGSAGSSVRSQMIDPTSVGDVSVATSEEMIKVGFMEFPKSTTEEMVQIQGQYGNGPRWMFNGVHVGIYSQGIPGPTSVIVKAKSWLTMGITGKVSISGPDDWQGIIAETLSHDCNFPADCITSSMVDATAGHRYGALRDFIPNLPTRINKDFVGLTSMDGSGGSDANKEPDNPIVATAHPITGDTWGIYMYLAVTHGDRPWGGPENPVVLLMKFKKVPDCGDFITLQNVATVAALTWASGGTYGLLTSLGIISSCYIWQFIKVVVAVVVAVAEAIYDAVKAVVCTLTSVPGLAPAVTKTGVQTKNPTATAVGVGLTVAGALCNNGACPLGATQTAIGCACVPGYVPGVVNGVTTCVVDTPWYSSPIALVVLAVVGVLGYSILKDDKPKTARSAA